VEERVGETIPQKVVQTRQRLEGKGRAEARAEERERGVEQQEEVE
jgi:hypothetical protein